MFICPLFPATAFLRLRVFAKTLIFLVGPRFFFSDISRVPWLVSAVPSLHGFLGKDLLASRPEFFPVVLVLP